jgi:hypothetical protein
MGTLNIAVAKAAAKQAAVAEAAAAKHAAAEAAARLSILSVADTAALLRCTSNHVRHLCKSGRLACSRLPGVAGKEKDRGRIVITMDSIRTMLAQTKEVIQ